MRQASFTVDFVRRRRETISTNDYRNVESGLQKRSIRSSVEAVRKVAKRSTSIISGVLQTNEVVCVLAISKEIASYHGCFINSSRFFYRKGVNHADAVLFVRRRYQSGKD